jgi:predicted AlkP superfamily phosphohydrolase/phosphomutase
MRRGRVVAIGLDGLETSVADRFMASGDMPALAELRREAACFVLDHGPAQRTGLAWEHVASGRSPEAAQRWAAVEFDPSTYRVWQEGARFTPWWTNLSRSVVVFDTPYVDLRRAPTTRGVVAWGAHDPGARLAARPRLLLRDFRQRFGAYPSKWTYATPWGSVDRSREMGEILGRALETRARAAHWLATERLPDWDLFFAVAGEVHGAIEGLWHGVDAKHPLHRHPSAASAAESLRAIHRALDGMIATLVRSAGRDAAIVAFAMGGMGPNHSDVQSMVLLPELLYRHAFDSPLLRVPAPWTAARDHLPIVGEDEPWNVASCVPLTVDHGHLSQALRSFVQQRPRLRAGVRALQAALLEWRAAAEPIPTRSLNWQPASRYATHWPRMPAFALPSFYDGRIRINLKGRERDGIVEASRYENVCRNIETLLRECRNPLTGEPAVESIERATTGDPLRLGSSESDVLVVWRGVATALEHPRLGLIGPVPLRRTGGHTGRRGIAYVRAPGIRVGDHGVRSAFDVAPTIIELLGCEPDGAVSGASLLTGSGMLSRASW